MKIRPIDERVLIKPYKEEERKVGSIIIPDTAKERPQMGEVVALGDDIEIADRKQKKLSDVLKVTYAKSPRLAAMIRTARGVATL